MHKKIAGCALCVALLLAACGQSQEASQPPMVTVTPPPGMATPTAAATPGHASALEGVFSMEDLAMGELAYGADRAAVVALFGEPDETDDYEEEATGHYFHDMYYADGSIYSIVSEGMEDMPSLRRVYVVSPGVPGPRGLEVGDTLEKLLAAFPNDGDGNILYAADVIDLPGGEKLYLPPRGQILEEPDDQGRTEIWYAAPVEPYGDMDDSGEYVYQRHAMACFFVKDGVIVAYLWQVSAMAE